MQTAIRNGVFPHFYNTFSYYAINLINFMMAESVLAFVLFFFFMILHWSGLAITEVLLQLNNKQPRSMICLYFVPI